MVYNNPMFMHAPFETLIKLYRNQMGPKGQATIEGYSTHFFDFLKRDRITNSETEKKNLHRLLVAAVTKVTSAAQEKLEGILLKHRRIRMIDERQALSSTIDEFRKHYDELDAPLPVEHRPDLFSSRDRKREVREAVVVGLRGFSSSNVIRRDLSELLVLMLKKSLSDHYSGVVFAGLGEEEIFPTLVEVRTDGFLDGALSYQIGQHQNIARSGTETVIIPFAQTEMVGRFMEGVDPRFVDYANGSFAFALKKFASEVVLISIECCESELGTSFSRTQKTDLVTRIMSSVSDAANTQVESFAEDARRFRKEDFVDPILEIVEFLPKDELANMAEALVSLTSLKRRVSSDHESVGGPIDVAVISKGDGFVWIKRKRYFQSELN